MQSPYEIFVRELIAKVLEICVLFSNVQQINQDGNDQNEIMLLDANGCPTEGQIMGPLAKGKKGEAKDLVANFDAFKFPSSEVSHS